MLYGNKLFFHEYDAKAFFYSNLKTYVLFPVDWAVNALTKLCFQEKKSYLSERKLTENNFPHPNPAMRF